MSTRIGFSSIRPFRRKVLFAFGASALATPFGSFAQPQGKVWRVGFLSARRRPASIDSDIYTAFSSRMRELGYFEGKNLVIEWRFADGVAERLSQLAVELVKANVDVIVTAGPQTTKAAQKSTATIPIVMGSVGDPVGLGFVKSLAHPGGNITGLSNMSADISPKQLEMLLSIAPKRLQIAMLVNPANPVHPTVLKIAQSAAQKLGVRVFPVEAGAPHEIELAFPLASRNGAGAMIIARDSMFNQQVRQIAQLAANHRLPSIAGIREYVEAGGLMSYGQNLADHFRQAATYVDKIFKGAKPGDLPVEQPTTLELFINGRTAKALGLKIPHSLLIMTDKVIE